DSEAIATFFNAFAVSVFHKCLRSDSDITNADERFDVIIAVCQSDNLLKFICVLN
ncbi:unnamed protein product, partial [Callosobruchus maculatus]